MLLARWVLISSSVSNGVHWFAFSLMAPATWLVRELVKRFQPGSAAVGSATVMSGLVFQLTGSPVAVGAVSTNLRLGWLLLQLL